MSNIGIGEALTHSLQGSHVSPRQDDPLQRHNRDGRLLLVPVHGHAHGSDTWIHGLRPHPNLHGVGEPVCVSVAQIVDVLESGQGADIPAMRGTGRIEVTTQFERPNKPSHNLQVILNSQLHILIRQRKAVEDRRRYALHDKWNGGLGQPRSQKE